MLIVIFFFLGNILWSRLWNEFKQDEGDGIVNNIRDTPMMIAMHKSLHHLFIDGVQENSANVAQNDSPANHLFQQNIRGQSSTNNSLKEESTNQSS